MRLPSRRRRVSRLPRAVWGVALIAVVNALCWAFITPAYQVPDEPGHAGYAQYIAETGKLPLLATNPFSQNGASEEQAVLFDVLPFSTEAKPTWSSERNAIAKRRLGKDIGRSSRGQALNVINNPPLYYLLEAIPYRLAYNQNYLGRLFAMRAFSALFAGFTAAFAYLFLRQALPGRPQAWAVGGLCVAFQPVLGFISGGVNNDALVYAAGAATLWGLARAFRQGLTRSTGTHIGVALAVGLLTKATMVGLLPGVAVALLVLWNRSRPAGRFWPRRPALVGLGAAGAFALLPYVAYSVGRRLATGSAPPVAGGLQSQGLSALDSAKSEVGFIWQAVLPRLPFMNDQFDYYPLWQIYFKGFVGRFGWAEFGFPDTWYWAALAIFLSIGALAVRALVVRRAVVRRRAGELLAYGTLFLGLLLAVEVIAYRYLTNPLSRGLPFEQARYLFPLLALYGGLVAVATLGVRSRWSRPLGVVLVTLAMGQSVLAQLVTLARYYT